MVRMHFALEYVYHYSTNEFAMFSNSLWQRKGKANLQCSPRAYPQWHSTTFLMVFLLELRKQSIDTNQVVDLTGFIHSAWTCVMCSCPMHLCALCFELWSSTPSEIIRNQLNNHISCRNVFDFSPIRLLIWSIFENPLCRSKNPRDGTRVGSETESEDSDWTVKTSYTVLRDEAVPFLLRMYPRCFFSKTIGKR